MAIELASAYVSMFVKLENAESQIRSQLNGIDVTSSGEEMGSRAGKGFGAGFGIVAGAATAITQAAMSAIGNSIGSAVSRIDTMNNFPKIMSNLGIDSTAAAASIETLSEKLTGLPTTLDSAASGVTNFVSKNNDIAKSTDMFLALNNAVLAGGQASEIQSTALDQLSQAYSKGKMDMMEWRSLQTAMPAQLNQIAQAMGKSADELGEGLRNGTITMDEFMDKIIELDKSGTGGFASFAEQAKNATGGLETSIANMQTAVTRGIASVIDAIGIENITAVIGMISQGIGTLGKVIAGLVEEFSPAIESIMEFMNGTLTLEDAIWGVTHTISEVLLSGMDNLVTNMLPAGIEIVMGIVDGLTAALPEIIGIVSKLVPLLIQSLVGALPQLINGAITLFLGLVDGLLQALPEIITAITTAIPLIIEAIVTAVPLLIEGALTLFMGLMDGLVQALPQIITAVVEAIPLIITAIVEAIPLLIEGAIQLFIGIIEGLAQALPQIINALIMAIPQIAQALISCIPQILSAAVTLFMAIVQAIPQILGSLIGAIGQLIQGGIDSIPSFLGQMAQAGIDLINGLIKGIGDAAGNVLGGLIGIKDSIFEFFANAGSWLMDAGRWIIDGLLDGIQNGMNNVIDFVSGIGDTIASLKGPKEYDLNLLVPAGGWIMQGLKTSMEDGLEGVLASVSNAGVRISSALNLSIPSALSIPDMAYNIKANTNASALAAMPAYSSFVATGRPTKPNEGYERLVAVMQSGFDKLYNKSSDVLMDGKKVGQVTFPWTNQNFGRVAKIAESGF